LTEMSVRNVGVDGPGSVVLPASSEPCHPSRARLSARMGWCGLAGLFLGASVIVVSAGRTDWLLPVSLRFLGSVGALPGWVAGVFGHSGIDLELGGLIAVLSVMFVSYAAAIRAADQLSPRTVLVGVASLNALVLLAPLLMSTDVFSYVAYGRIGALYGANPYFHGPNAIALDPAYPFIATRWAATPTVYGPLFTALSYLLAPLSLAWNVLAYKAIAAISSLVIVVVVWMAARLRDLDPVRAVVIVGLNPVILVYGVGGGHNDLLMLAILLVGVYLQLRGNGRANGALIVAAAGVKLTAGLLLPFVVAHNARGRGGRGLRALLTGVCIAAAVGGVLSFVFFGGGPIHLLSTLQKVQQGGGLNSVPGFLLALLGLGRLSAAAGPVLTVAFGICVVWLLRRVWTGRMDWITGVGWATAALIMTAGLLVPWYVAWLVPFAALSDDRRLWAATVLLTGLGLTTL
jgi:alpha-1,6-mannosyltransferase